MDFYNIEFAKFYIKSFILFKIYMLSLTTFEFKPPEMPLPA